MSTNHKARSRSTHTGPSPSSAVRPQTFFGAVGIAFLTLKSSDGPKAGGAEGNRTPDLCSAIAALSHLSYSPAPPPYVKPEASPGYQRAAPLAACSTPCNRLSQEGVGLPIWPPLWPDSSERPLFPIRFVCSSGWPLGPAVCLRESITWHMTAMTRATGRATNVHDGAMTAATTAKDARD